MSKRYIKLDDVMEELDRLIRTEQIELIHTDYERMERYFESMSRSIKKSKGYIIPKTVGERFYINGTSINGFHAIYDRDDKEHALWIDCPKDYLPVIVEALNNKFSV